MITISVNNFQSYDYESMLEFLNIQEETNFRIVLSARKTNERADIFYNYYIAMFVGEKLKAISLNFSYAVPVPIETGPFTFDIEMKDMAQLAGFLHYVVAGYYERTPETTNTFRDDIKMFWAINFKIKETLTCSEFARIMDTYGRSE